MKIPFFIPTQIAGVLRITIVCIGSLEKVNPKIGSIVAIFYQNFNLLNLSFNKVKTREKFDSLFFTSKINCEMYTFFYIF